MQYLVAWVCKLVGMLSNFVPPWDLSVPLCQVFNLTVPLHIAYVGKEKTRQRLGTITRVLIPCRVWHDDGHSD